MDGMVVAAERAVLSMAVCLQVVACSSGSTPAASAGSSGNSVDVPVPNCAANGSAAPCWMLTKAGWCAPGELTFTLTPDAAAQNAASLTSTLTCTVCQQGSSAPGC